MFNVAVFKLKDMIKYLVVMTISILLVIFATRYFSSKSKDKNISIDIGKIVDLFMSNTYLDVIEIQMPTIKEAETKNLQEENQNKNYLQGFLETEISSLKVIKDSNKDNKVENEETKEDNKNIENKEQEEVKTAQTGVETEVVTNNPITESFNVQYGAVKLKNQTQINLTQEILTPNITIDNKNVLIFHTHSCESYTSSDLFPYTPTGNFRTTDLNYTVTRVGTELENQLKQYNIPVIHDTSYHDYPAYNGSYTKSLQTVENILKTTQADIIIDLHRDAIGSRPDYAPTVKIGDDYASQMMFVIGTNEGGLNHPNWEQNLKFAIKVQEKAEEMYPGLFKPIMVTPNRYNQHTGKYASIIEVGSTGNTLEQSLTSMKYLAKVLDEVMR